MPLSTIYSVILLPLILCAVQPSAWAETEPKDNEVVIAIGFSLEPYVFKSGHGIISHLIRESLELSGKTGKFELLSNAKAIEYFATGQCDVMALVGKDMVDGYLSQPYVMFQNFAISLENRNIKLNTLSDLKNHSLIGFSNARKYLGEEFAAITVNKSDYQEMDKQFNQIKALFDGKVDVIVAEQTIFRFFHSRLKNRYPLNENYRQATRFHKLFPESIYHAAFHSKQLRDDFDRGMEKLSESGQVDKIYWIYTDLLKQY